MKKGKFIYDFNPFFVFVYLSTWLGFGFISIIILLTTIGHYTKNKLVLFFLTAIMSFLFTHILFRFVGRKMRTSRQIEDGDMFFIPFFSIMMFWAPGNLDFISRILKRVFKIDKDFRNNNYSEWITIATGAQLILIFIFAFWFSSLFVRF